MELFSLVDAVARVVGLTMSRHNVLEEDRWKNAWTRASLKIVVGDIARLQGGGPAV